LDPTAYIQVVGRDAKKNQYVYHPMFTELTTIEKYKRLEKFCMCIGPFMTHVSKIINNKNCNKNCNSEDYSKEFIICILFRIMFLTHFRVGNDTYDTYGLTTLEKRHVSLKKPNTIIFDFIGKKNVVNHKEISDSVIYDILSKLLKNKMNSQKIFETEKYTVSALDMNNYLQRVMGSDFSCKDFRTYASNKIFVKCLCNGLSLKESYEYVAKELCHTKFVSKKSYVMNKIEDLYKRDNTAFNKNVSLNNILNIINKDQ